MADFCNGRHDDGRHVAQPLLPPTTLLLDSTDLLGMHSMQPDGVFIDSHIKYVLLLNLLIFKYIILNILLNNTQL